MLIEFILKKSTPTSVKLSEDLQSTLFGASHGIAPTPGNDSVGIANILQSVAAELKSIAESNGKLHDKLNKLNSGKFLAASPGIQRPLISSPSLANKPNGLTACSSLPIEQQKAGSISKQPKYVVGSNHNAPTTLSAAPVVKFGEIFVSRFDPKVDASQIKNELFSNIDAAITQMVTKHPSYASFHIRVNASKLAEILQPSFWPEGIMIKRFWGRLLPEKIAAPLVSKN